VSNDNGFVIQSDDGREFAVIVKQWR